MEQDKNKLDDFVVLVYRMRLAQRIYFKKRHQDDLIEAKKLEKEVDDFVLNYKFKEDKENGE